MKDFVVGIPTLCRYDLLKITIEAIHSSYLKPRAVFILDNGSNCPPLEATIIKSHYNQGVSGAWNGLWEAAGDLPIILINDDLKVARDSFSLLMDDPNQITLGNGFSLVKLNPELKQKVGLFDERFWPAYWEDVDYRIRVDKAGITTGIVPNSSEHQQGCSNTFKVNKWMHPFIDQNRLKMKRKWNISGNEELKEIGQYFDYPDPTIIDPYQEHLDHCQHLPLTVDYSHVVAKWKKESSLNICN